MTEAEIKDIQKEVYPNETRMFTIVLQGKHRFSLNTLYITQSEYWVEEDSLTTDQFLELLDYGEGDQNVT